MPLDLIPAAIERYRDYFSQIGIQQNRLYGGVPEMLAELSSAGVTLGLATSKLEEFAEHIAEQFDIAEYFKVIAGATRDGARISKLDIVGFALERLAWPEPATAALVGDRADDIRAAIYHGLVPVGAGWGYGTDVELESSGSRVIVDRPEALNRWLLR